MKKSLITFCKFLILISLLPWLFCNAWKKTALHWELIETGHSENLHNGYFVNDQNGWIISYGTGRIWHTEDGGVNWQFMAQLDSIYFEDIVFTSPDTGWICGEYGSLLQTSDGGKSWLKKLEADSGIAFYGIDFISPREGLLAGFKVDTRSPVILITKDGGGSWTLQPPAIPLSGGIEHIWFADDLNWYLGGRGFILNTTDGGNHWQASMLNENATIRGLFFFNKKRGWAAGHDGMVFDTRNGGRSWLQHEKFTENRLRNICFITKKTGYICGDNNKENVSLWQTGDGGKSWLPAMQDTPDIHRIIRSQGCLWLIGKEGLLMRMQI